MAADDDGEESISRPFADLLAQLHSGARHFVATFGADYLWEYEVRATPDL